MTTKTSQRKSATFYDLNLGNRKYPENTPDELRRAALTVCDHATSADEARDVLRQLGLLTQTPTGTRS